VGIGAATARALARTGHDIFFTHFDSYDKAMYEGVAQNEPSLIRAELEGLGARVADLSVDMSTIDSSDTILTTCRERLGAPSVLINNAAYSTTQPWDQLTVDDIDRHLAVNYRASTLLSLGFAKGFTRGEGGRIVSMTSGQSLGPMPNELAYASSKGAIEAFVKSFFVPAGKLGITVNAVNPGPNDTGWMSDELQEYLTPKFALGRVGLPTDPANVIAFLCSPEGGWITGQVINVEGGFTRD
jgi:3-oxoacyl-[acyl-carrier protein] reductase